MFLNCVTPCMGVWIETDTAPLNDFETLVTPCMGVWIETCPKPLTLSVPASHPVWVCGLKHFGWGRPPKHARSHPVWVCGLKLIPPCGKFYLPAVTPCMGVWIETRTLQVYQQGQGHTLYGCVDWNVLPLSRISSVFQSHPVWVCGLKLIIGTAEAVPV